MILWFVLYVFDSYLFVLSVFSIVLTTPDTLSNLILHMFQC